MPVPDEGLGIVPDKGSIFNMEMQGADRVAWWTSCVALVPAAKTFPAKVPGHYITVGKKMSKLALPVIVEQNNDLDDVIVLAFKVVDTKVYAVCIMVPTLLAWKPPKEAKTEVSDAAMLSVVRLPCATMVAVKPLANTETAKLKDLTDKLLSHLPLFKNSLIKSTKDLQNISQQLDVKKNFNRAIDSYMLKLKKVAGEHGKTSRDNAESVAGGQAAAKQAAELKAMVIPHAKFYSEILEERFVFLGTQEDGSINEQNINDAIDSIERCATHVHEHP
jgi:hypothetical protein